MLTAFSFPSSGVSAVLNGSNAPASSFDSPTVQMAIFSGGICIRPFRHFWRSPFGSTLTAYAPHITAQYVNKFIIMDFTNPDATETTQPMNGTAVSLVPTTFDPS